MKAVKKTGRKQLLFAGIVTDVCVAHLALAAVEDGYEVFVVADASGHLQRRRPRRGLEPYDR